MKQHRWNHLASLTAGVLFLSLSTAAFAQYVWLDEKGGKQYSDMPPPASVPKSRVLKEPGQYRSTAQNDQTVTDENAPAPTVKKEKSPMTTAEKNTDFQKRKIEQAEKEKKAADESKRLADKAKNCERARQYQTALEEGHRIGETDKNGERSFMSDEKRNQEIRENKQTLSECR